MAQLTSKRLILIAAALLVLTVAASPLFFAPYWQPGYPAARNAPLDLEAVQKVELNTADAETLCTLPGIGEDIAHAIVEHRYEYGPFTELHELACVEGITEEMIRSWGDLAWVDPDAD